jgi:hypothetical protein
VLRQWSDALAAAGLFAEALTVHPGAERVDIVRQAELAVLAGDHTAALTLLAELEVARTLRTRRITAPSEPPGPPKPGPPKPGPPKPGPAKPAQQPPPSPWLQLLTDVATLLAGLGDLGTVLESSRRVQPSGAVAWMVALAATVAGDLREASEHAIQAREGGCRDLRMVVIVAAEQAAEQEYRTALELIAGAQRIALPDEDPAGLTVDLLNRSGFRQQGRKLALLGARELGAGRLRSLGRSLSSASALGERRRERSTRRAETETLQDLTCRCYGSGGWIGPDRLYYVSRHLDELLSAPVAGLQARLLLCRATNLTFLDVIDRELTLPVASEPLERPAPHPAGPAGPGGAAGAAAGDSEERPTPGMGFSLGMARPA